MIVIVVIGVLATIAIPNYIRSLQASKEAVLKEDLHVLRQQIDAYTNDKEKAPQSLDDLVSAGYMKSIPEDPMTHSNTTWVTDHRRLGAKPRPDRLRHQRRPQRLVGTGQRRPALFRVVATRIH